MRSSLPASSLSPRGKTGQRCLGHRLRGIKSIGLVSYRPQDYGTEIQFCYVLISFGTKRRFKPAANSLRTSVIKKDRRRDIFCILGDDKLLVTS